MSIGKNILKLPADIAILIPFSLSEVPDPYPCLD